jgi:hypothetical protein
MGHSMRGNIIDIEPGGPSERSRRIARIAVLLGELEALSDAAHNVPFSLLMEARAHIEKARTLLEDYRHTAANADEEGEGDGDPQPHVDRDVLDRMYRRLEAGRRSPER